MSERIRVREHVPDSQDGVCPACQDRGADEKGERVDPSLCNFVWLGVRCDQPKAHPGDHLCGLMSWPRGGIPLTPLDAQPTQEERIGLIAWKAAESIHRYDGMDCMCYTDCKCAAALRARKERARIIQGAINEALEEARRG